MSENDQPFQGFAHQLSTHLAEAIVRASGNVLHVESITFAVPPKPELGDIAFLCFGLAHLWKKDVNHTARDLVHAFQPTEYIEHVEAAGPYLNIFFHRQAVATALLQEILREQNRYGSTRQEHPQKIVLEYISANTNKPLHLGHVRNGLLGWSVAELLRRQGHEVNKTDIVNDRGVHIMKSLLAYTKWGNGATPESTGTKPDHFVADYYVKFEQAYQKEYQAWLAQEKIDLGSMDERAKDGVEAQFRKISAVLGEAQELLQKWEAGDNNVRSRWEQMNAWAYAGWKTTYDALGFDFDQHYYESQIYEHGKKIVERALADGVFQKAENGAIVVPLSQSSDLPDIVAMRSDGTSLYITQDLYLAGKRFDDYHFDRLLYVVGSEQDVYFQQLVETMKLLTFPAADRLFHMSYGYVSLPEGRMKSREGTVVDADDLLSEVTQLADTEVRRRYPDLAEAERSMRARSIALAALKFHFLLVGRKSAMVFHPEESLAFEGRTGPYLQYAYARAGSILRKAGDVPNLKNATIVDDSEWQIILQLLSFPNEVQQAAEEYEPAKLANYLIELAQTFSTFYHDQPVLNAAKDIRTTRLAIVRAFQTVIRNGLGILGIETLEEM